MDQTFKNPGEVAEHLKAKGWKVAARTVYAHVKKGLLKPEKDGTFALKSVQRYASANLELVATRQRVKDENISDARAKAELARTMEQAKLARFKREKMEGKYILRSDFDLELAARAVVLDNGIRGEIQTRAQELIDIMEGNQKKIKAFISELFDILDRGLNLFAKKNEWQVIFQDEDSGE